MITRRGRVLAAIGDLGLVLDVGAESEGVMDLAGRHGLTVYDALYLEPAQRKGLPLEHVRT
jgi:predicted nucleic acid-binding protein